MPTGSSSTSLQRAVEVALDYIGVHGKRKRVTDETVDAVRADGTAIVGGESLSTSGVFKGMQAGDRVKVAWSRTSQAVRKPKRNVILAHQVRRNIPPMNTQQGGQIVEELFIANRDDGVKDVFFRNAFQCSPLKLDSFGIPTVSLETVKWGQGNNMFYVLSGVKQPNTTVPGHTSIIVEGSTTKKYHIFKINRELRTPFTSSVDIVQLISVDNVVDFATNNLVIAETWMPYGDVDADSMNPYLTAAGTGNPTLGSSYVFNMSSIRGSSTVPVGGGVHLTLNKASGSFYVVMQRLGTLHAYADAILTDVEVNTVGNNSLSWSLLGTMLTDDGHLIMTCNVRYFAGSVQPDFRNNPNQPAIGAFPYTHPYIGPGPRTSTSSVALEYIRPVIIDFTENKILVDGFRTSNADYLFIPFPPPTLSNIIDMTHGYPGSWGASFTPAYSLTEIYNFITYANSKDGAGEVYILGGAAYVRKDSTYGSLCISPINGLCTILSPLSSEFLGLVEEMSLSHIVWAKGNHATLATGLDNINIDRECFVTLMDSGKQTTLPVAMSTRLHNMELNLLNTDFMYRLDNNTGTLPADTPVNYFAKIWEFRGDTTITTAEIVTQNVFPEDTALRDFKKLAPIPNGVVQPIDITKYDLQIINYDKILQPINKFLILT